MAAQSSGNVKNYQHQQRSVPPTSQGSQQRRSSSDNFLSPRLKDTSHEMVAVSQNPSVQQPYANKTPVLNDYSDQMEKLPNGRFKCNICNYEASYASALRIHIRTHFGEKPYKCQYCTYSASTSGNLKTHLRKHTGESPFACTLCDYRAKHNISLKTHLANVHHVNPHRMGAAYSHMMSPALIHNQTIQEPIGQNLPPQQSYSSRGSKVPMKQSRQTPSIDQQAAMLQSSQQSYGSEYSAPSQALDPLSPGTNPSPYSVHSSLESPASYDQLTSPADPFPPTPAYGTYQGEEDGDSTSHSQTDQ